MNTYTKVLEFFMENGVQLSPDQMDKLRSITNESFFSKNKKSVKESSYIIEESVHIKNNIKDDFEGKDKIESVVNSNKSKVMSNFNKYIDELYDNWYDTNPDHEPDENENLSKEEVKKLAKKLFDLIVIKQSSDGQISAEYWINNYYNKHSESKKFFGNHSMSQKIYFDQNTMKITKINKPQLEG